MDLSVLRRMSLLRWWKFLASMVYRLGVIERRLTVFRTDVQAFLSSGRVCAFIEELVMFYP